MAELSPEDIAAGEELDFAEEKEYWNIYKLSDGTTLKVKLVLTGVKRLNQYMPDGSPIYLIRSTNAVRAVNISKNLTAKPKPSKTPIS